MLAFQLVLDGDNPPNRVVLEWEDRTAVPNGPCQVSLSSEGMHARWLVPTLSGPKLASFFDQLGRLRVIGGQVEFETPDADLAVVGEFSAHRDPPEGWLWVSLASDASGPYWMANVRLTLSVGSLTRLAGQVGAFFGEAEVQQR